MINGLEHRLKEYRCSIEDIAIEPLAAICQALPEEFCAETEARSRYLSGMLDGVVAGGIYDDLRIYRYMHGSHAVIANGLPQRWAGNRVFPNGFFEVILKRGSELIIYGDVTETKKFTVYADGKCFQSEFDENGMFRMPLVFGEDTVTVRLAKNGPIYPRIYAVATR